MLILLFIQITEPFDCTVRRFAYENIFMPAGLVLLSLSLVLASLE